MQNYNFCFFCKRNFPLLITLYDYSRHSALFHVVPKNLQWDFARRISGEFLPPLEYCNIFYLSETDINTFFFFLSIYHPKRKGDGDTNYKIGWKFILLRTKKTTTITLCVSVQDRYCFDCGWLGYDIFSFATCCTQ